MSFVEKALSIISEKNRDIAPLGEVRDDTHTETLAEKSIASESDVVKSHEPQSIEASKDGLGSKPVVPRRGRRFVAFDQDRLREEGFLATEKYHRQLADEYRRIKRPLVANAFGIGVPPIERGNFILVTSAVSGEGKTHTCLNLALSLSAERDRTVLLVDGDVPKPHISRLLGVADQPGLLDALGDRPMRLEDLLIRTDIPRLSVLPAGTWKDNAPELLASHRMAELCSELADRYPDRIILVDSPPLLAATEAQSIAAHVGQIVLVVAESATARSDVRAALSLLDEQKPVNAILNKSRLGTPGGYYRGYGYGGGTDLDEKSGIVPKS